ncbi:MAG TPA: hypothetical protein VF101_17915 [Gaiellaceae bacterium]
MNDRGLDVWSFESCAQPLLQADRLAKQDRQRLRHRFATRGGKPVRARFGIPHYDPGAFSPSELAVNRRGRRVKGGCELVQRPTSLRLKKEQG